MFFGGDGFFSSLIILNTIRFSYTDVLIAQPAHTHTYKVKESEWVSEWELEREWTQSGSSVCAMVCVCVWMHRSNVLHHQQYFTINGFWVGLSNCFLFVLLNSLYIFEMLMPVPENMLWKVYKSIWDVLQCATENMFVRFWFLFFIIIIVVALRLGWWTNDWASEYRPNRDRKWVRLVCQCFWRNGMYV